jgi:hypothetical protein
MSAWLIAAAAVTGWLGASRALFRHWWRYDSLQGRRRCPNKAHWSYYRSMGYTHHGKCCLGTEREPWSMPAVAGLAMLAGLFWPFAILAGLIVWRAPRAAGEIEGRIKELESELGIKP